MSDGEVPTATEHLELRFDEVRRIPEDFDQPVDYSEDVLAGPRSIEIRREASISPEEGLNALMLAARPETFQYTEIRIYGPFRAPSSFLFFNMQ